MAITMHQAPRYCLNKGFILLNYLVLDGDTLIYQIKELSNFVPFSSGWREVELKIFDVRCCNLVNSCAKILTNLRIIAFGAKKLMYKVIVH